MFWGILTRRAVVTLKGTLKKWKNNDLNHGWFFEGNLAHLNRMLQKNKICDLNKAVKSLLFVPFYYFLCKSETATATLKVQSLYFNISGHNLFRDEMLERKNNNLKIEMIYDTKGRKEKGKWVNRKQKGPTGISRMRAMLLHHHVGDCCDNIADF